MSGAPGRFYRPPSLNHTPPLSRASHQHIAGRVYMRPIIPITIILTLLTSCAAHPATPPRLPMHTDNPTAPPALLSPTLKPPDSSLPAAGICGTAQGSYAEVRINPDTPAPRCQHI